LLPLISIPCFEQAPKPLKKPRGIEITIAHGQETTSAESPLYIHSLHSPWKKSGGTTIISKAIRQTMGV